MSLEALDSLRYFFIPLFAVSFFVCALHFGPGVSHCNVCGAAFHKLHRCVSLCRSQALAQAENAELKLRLKQQGEREGPRVCHRLLPLLARTRDALRVYTPLYPVSSSGVLLHVCILHAEEEKTLPPLEQAKKNMTAEVLSATEKTPTFDEVEREPEEG